MTFKKLMIWDVSLDYVIVTVEHSFSHSRLGMKLGNCDVYQKTNRETMVSIHDSVRARDVYIIQTGLDNNSIMEMLIMSYACKTSSAKKVVGVIPYLPYSKQCKN